MNDITPADRSLIEKGYVLAFERVGKIIASHPHNDTYAYERIRDILWAEKDSRVNIEARQLSLPVSICVGGEYREEVPIYSDRDLIVWGYKTAIKTLNHHRAHTNMVWQGPWMFAIGILETSLSEDVA